MTFITGENGTVSTGNNTILNLPLGGSFTGTYEEVVKYSELTILLALNFSGGEKVTISLYFSPDNGVTSVLLKTIL